MAKDEDECGHADSLNLQGNSAVVAKAPESCKMCSPNDGEKGKKDEQRAIYQYVILSGACSCCIGGVSVSEIIDEALDSRSWRWMNDDFAEHSANMQPRDFSSGRHTMDETTLER